MSKTQLDLTGLDFVVVSAAFDRTAILIENVGF
jgi:hypothetical protein